MTFKKTLGGGRGLGHGLQKHFSSSKFKLKFDHSSNCQTLSQAQTHWFSHYHMLQTTCCKAFQNPGKLSEEQTFAASAQLCQQSSFEFLVLAIETSGGFGSSATSFLAMLAKRCADNNLPDRAAEKHQCFQRTNVAVHRSNASMVVPRVIPI